MSEKKWQVRENQNESSELYHYGVLGMRWGVRKDRSNLGKFGSDKTGSGYVKASQNLGRDKASIPNDWYGMLQKAEKIDKRLSSAVSVVGWTNTASNKENKYYSKFSNDLKNGHSDRDPNLDKWLKQFEETTGRKLDPTSDMATIAYLINYGISRDGKMSDEEWKELEELTQIYEALLEYYKGTYLSELIQDEESEMVEEQKKLREKLSKAMEENDVNLRGNQTITVENVSGRLSYVYSGEDGKYRWSEPVDSEDGLQKLLKLVKRESEDLKDFRNRRSSTRTRERNVTGNGVSLKKRDSIEITDKERQQKIISSRKAQEEGVKILEGLLKISETQTQARKDQLKRSRNYKVSNRR